MLLLRQTGARTRRRRRFLRINAECERVRRRRLRRCRQYRWCVNNFESYLCFSYVAAVLLLCAGAALCCSSQYSFNVGMRSQTRVGARPRQRRTRYTHARAHAHSRALRHKHRLNYLRQLQHAPKVCVRMCDTFLTPAVRQHERVEIDLNSSKMCWMGYRSCLYFCLCIVYAVDEPIIWHTLHRVFEINPFGNDCELYVLYICCRVLHRLKFTHEIVHEFSVAIM